MKGRNWAIFVMVMVIGVLGRPGVRAAIPIFDDQIRNALTPIDSLPSSQQLNLAHGGEQSALDNLQAIALQANGDPGLQLRAVRALTQYCKEPCATHEAHLTLLDLIQQPRYRDARAGSDLLILRAIMEAIGVLQVPEDLSYLVVQLEHPSRDIRAAAANALARLGNTAAISPLRMRYQFENGPGGVAQVRLAIADALRILGQPIQ
jgi:HEAT repeat protein